MDPRKFSLKNLCKPLRKNDISEASVQRVLTLIIEGYYSGGFKSAFSATPTRVGRSPPVNPTIDHPPLPVRTQLESNAHDSNQTSHWE